MAKAASFNMNFEEFGKLERVPVELGVKRWQNIQKERVLKVTRIEEIPQEKFTSHVLHYIQSNGVEGRVYAPKSFLHHVKMHREGRENIFFFVKDNVPEGEVDFDIRFN